MLRKTIDPALPTFWHVSLVVADHMTLGDHVCDWYWTETYKMGVLFPTMHALTAITPKCSVFFEIEIQISGRENIFV